MLCVDDHELIADGLAARMAVEPDLECVGHLESADLLVATVKELRAQVVLLDLSMPGPDPLERLVDLKRACPEVAVVVLSAHVRDHFIDTALARGASGYFSKYDSSASIFEGIRRATLGRIALSDEVSSRLRHGSVPGHSGTATGSMSRLSSLSPRELEVLRLVGKGMSRAQIARDFCRSLKTIDAQHTSIMKKLDIHDRAELTRFAIAEGLVEA